MVQPKPGNAIEVSDTGAPKQTVREVQIVESAILTRRAVAQDIVEVTLSIESDSFSYDPGQYIRITLARLLYEDPRGNYRDFSISSFPTGEGLLRITIHLSQSGFKRTLMEAPIGSSLKLTGPFGNFRLPPDTAAPLLYIASGIGITPFFSKVGYATENQLPNRITLLYSTTSVESAAYLQDIHDMAARNKYLTVRHVIGQIDAKRIAEMLQGSSQPLIELSGPPSMNATIRDILIAQGVPSQNVKAEEFLGYNSGNGSATSAIRAFAIDDNHLTQALANLLDQSALVAAVDGQGTIVYANEVFVKVTKYAREELIGQNHRVLKSGYHDQSFYEDLWKTISGGNIWHGEIKNRAKDGTFYWVDTTIRPVFDMHKNIINYVAFRFVITERKEAESELALQKSRYEAVVLSLGEGLVVVDKDGVIMMANKACTDLLGFAEAELIGKPMAKTIIMQNEKGIPIPDDARLINRILEGKMSKLDTTGTSGSMYYYRRKDGKQIRISATIMPIIKDGQITGAVEVFRDYTHEGDVDRTKTEFVSLASHQLRTPLTAVSWYTETLLKGSTGPLNAEQRKYLEEVYKGSQRMVELVNSLLNVSRLELGTFTYKCKPTDIAELADSVISEQKLVIDSKKQRLHATFETGLPIIQADSKLLRMVLQNLLSNAVKYTQVGGTIRVNAVFNRPKRQVKLTITDNGLGIPKAQQKYIFTKLFRADNVMKTSTEGTGLGLYLTKLVIEGSGGTVHFTSEEGKGTSFTVTLPLTAKITTDNVR